MSAQNDLKKVTTLGLKRMKAAGEKNCRANRLRFRFCDRAR